MESWLDGGGGGGTGANIKRLYISIYYVERSIGVEARPCQPGSYAVVVSFVVYSNEQIGECWWLIWVTIKFSSHG